MRAARASTPSGSHALATLLVDADAGLLRWAPLFALAAGGAWLLWHSRRTRVARAVPERRDAEHAAFICLAVCGAQLLVAVFAVPRATTAALVPALPCAVPLVAWALQRWPRVGAALGVLTLALIAWAALASGGWPTL